MLDSRRCRAHIRELTRLRKNHSKTGLEKNNDFAVRLLFQFPFTRVTTANVRSKCGYRDSHLKEIIADYSRFNTSAGAQRLEIWSRWVFLRERAAEKAFTTSTSGCLYQTKPRWS